MLRQIGALTFAVILTSSAARAQIIPAGTEFQVNTYTTGDQAFPQTCFAPDGGFVVVWAGYRDQDGDFTGVFGQRYGSGGAQLGTEFQINTYTLGFQTVPAVCCDAAGRFVVVWHSSDGDGNLTGVFGQRFASNGAFRGTEFQVNTYTTSIQANPDVCCSADGDFVVVWRSTGQDGSQDGIFGQRFASSGAFVGTEFQVNTYTSSEQDDAHVCCDTAGDFVVAWESIGNDGSKEGVFAQRFDSNGARRGTEFQANTYTSNNQESPAICCDSAGDFVIVWDSVREDGRGNGVFGQRFDSSGERHGTEFLVNTYTSGNEIAPSVCCGPNGDFVVAWAANYQDGGGADDYGIVARRFTPVGGASSEFLVNTYTTGGQIQPAVACDPKGNFVVVWNSTPQDGDGSGVFGQRFELLGVVPTPVLSFAGLAAGVVGLFAGGVLALRRRRTRG